MSQQFEIILPPLPRGFHLITHHITNRLTELPATGILHLFIKHTSAAITINENADPSVRKDLNEFFNRLVPENQSWFKHTTEGADDMPAHIKTAVVGFSVTVPITDGKLNLGTWQGIYLCEFRNQGGPRRVIATIIS